VEKVAPAAVTAETDPTVYEWAKRELFDKADLPLGMQSFVTVDGVEYYRYHAGATSFTWNNPRPLSGAVTITTRGVAQHGGTGSTRLRTFYDDGTEGPDLTIIQSGESKTVTVTTDASKTLAKITGNYDMENWVLLDMSVMSVIANYDAGLPAASADFCGGIKADKAESTDTQPVRIGADGKLYTAPGGSGSGGGSYTLPIAAAETLGGVKPVSKTEDMTQSVGVDETGGLWTATAKASGSAEKKWRLINSVTVEDYVENEDGTNNKVMKVWFSKDLNGNSIALDEIVVEIISNSTFVGSYNWLCLYETAGSTLNETKQWLREGASNTIRTVEVGPITNDGKRLLRTYSFSQYMDFAPIFNGGFDAGGYGKMKFSGPIKEVCYGGFNKVNGLTINLYGLDAVGE
ncbi:MAG: hypothetical protein IJX67_08315, partial [Oscillospiraceae bacterium]|nr:hypothetical protein [Oscillospiraceae bacterium]